MVSSYTYARPTIGFGRPWTPAVRAIILACGGVFLLQTLFVSIPFDLVFGLDSTRPGELWRWCTYLFLHGGVFHLLFNMFALWMFGMELENVWWSRKFLTYYLICGVGAGLSNLFVGPLFGPGGPTVGASGAIYGVLIAFGMMFPDRPIFVYFLLPIRARYFVMIYILLELYAGVTSSMDGIAHFAHLGGAAVGYLYILIDQRRLPLQKFFESRRAHVTKSERSRAFVRTDSLNVSDATYHDIRDDEDQIDQQRVDEILDKISQNGYQSLTEGEKKILFDASKKLN